MIVEVVEVGGKRKDNIGDPYGDGSVLYLVCQYKYTGCDH